MRDRRRPWSLALRHFVHLDQRHASAGPIRAADLGGVGPRRQGQNQRRVFAAVRQREGTRVAGGLRRRGGISGDDTPVIVFSDERGTGEDSQTGIGERTRDAEGREARSNRADQNFFRSIARDDEAPDQNILTRADVASSGKVNQALIVGVRITARVVDLSERHAAGCVGHNVGGVGTGREGLEQGGVFATRRERKGAEPEKGSSRRCGIGTGGPVVVLRDDLAAAIEAQLRIGQRALDAQARERGADATRG